jgi:alkaline phosphatase
MTKFTKHQQEHYASIIASAMAISIAIMLFISISPPVYGTDIGSNITDSVLEEIPDASDIIDDVEDSIPGGLSDNNVILMIGDGMGDSEITIARNYEVGAAGRLAMDELPFTGSMTTYSVFETDPSMPDYDPESASTSTAWSTGEKTADGRISTTPGTDEDLTTIIELAQDNGLKTGIVSTAELTDATNAAASTHVNNRSCQGPADMANCPQDDKSAGGPGSIAEQFVDHQVNVLLGGGKARFDQTITGGPDAGSTVVQSAVDSGYNVVTTAEELNNFSQNTSQLLGLFSDGNMALEWSGELAEPFPGTGPQECIENQRPSEQPSLDAMTTKAIELLESQSEGGGFFLQVEGASIDKQDHESNPCGQIGETIAFDRAVEAAMNFASEDENTIVIVTADHAHTSQIIEPPTETNQPGAFSTLNTKEGSEMTVLYATAPPGESQQHTGSQVRVAAMGPDVDTVEGVIDNTDLFDIITSVLNL